MIGTRRMYHPVIRMTNPRRNLRSRHRPRPMLRRMSFCQKRHRQKEFWSFLPIDGVDDLFLFVPPPLDIPGTSRSPTDGTKQFVALWPHWKFILRSLTCTRICFYWVVGSGKTALQWLKRNFLMKFRGHKTTFNIYDLYSYIGSVKYFNQTASQR